MGYIHISHSIPSQMIPFFSYLTQNIMLLPTTAVARALDKKALF